MMIISDIIEVFINVCASLIFFPAIQGSTSAHPRRTFDAFVFRKPQPAKSIDAMPHESQATKTPFLAQMPPCLLPLASAWPSWLGTSIFLSSASSAVGG